MYTCPFTKGNPVQTDSKLRCGPFEWDPIQHVGKKGNTETSAHPYRTLLLDYYKHLWEHILCSNKTPCVSECVCTAIKTFPGSKHQGKSSSSLKKGQKVVDIVIAWLLVPANCFSSALYLHLWVTSSRAWTASNVSQHFSSWGHLLRKGP